MMYVNICKQIIDGDQCVLVIDIVQLKLLRTRVKHLEVKLSKIQQDQHTALMTNSVLVSFIFT